MSHYETPEYEVLIKDDAFEKRLYKDFYIVEYENPNDPDAYNGFGTLFNYIGKANVQEEKISMTIPVIKEVTTQGMKMAFVVPQSKWENIPQPKDNRLKIAKFDQGVFASITYSGVSTTEKEQMQIQKLETWLTKNNFIKCSNFMVAIYNGPYILPLFRRNEVLVRIAE